MGGFFKDPIRSIKAKYEDVKKDPLKYAAPFAFGPGVGSTIIAAGESGGFDNGVADSMTKGAEQAAALEQESRQFSKDLFEKQLARQEPLLAEGEAALPQLVAALQNRPVNESLPSERIQGDLISEFLGENVPSYVKENALANLSAVESEQGKNRLSNLVEFALGGIGRDAQSREALGQSSGSSLMREGSTDANVLMQQALARQNMQNQIISGLSGLPSLVAAYGGRRNTPTSSGGFDLGYRPTVPLSFDMGGYA